MMTYLFENCNFKVGLDDCILLPLLGKVAATCFYTNQSQNMDTFDRNCFL